VIFKRNIHRLSDGKWHVCRSRDRKRSVSNHDVLRLHRVRLSQVSEKDTKISVEVFVVILTRVFFVIL